MERGTTLHCKLSIGCYQYWQYRTCPDARGSIWRFCDRDTKCFGWK
jgi:hypothetical protein